MDHFCGMVSTCFCFWFCVKLGCIGPSIAQYLSWLEQGQDGGNKKHLAELGTSSTGTARKQSCSERMKSIWRIFPSTASMSNMLGWTAEKSTSWWAQKTSDRTDLSNFEDVGIAKQIQLDLKESKTRGKLYCLKQPTKMQYDEFLQRKMS